MERLMIFEEISKVNIYLIWFYLLRGSRIYYLRLNKLFENHWLIKKCLNHNYLTKIEITDRVNYHDGFFYDLAFDNIEKIYNNFVTHNKLIKKIATLFESSKVELVFKKDLNEKLSRFYYINFILNKLNKLFPKKEILFVPSCGIDNFKTEGEEVNYYYDFLNIIHKSGASYYENKYTLFPWWVRLNNQIRKKRRIIKIYLKAIVFVFLFIYKYAVFRKSNCGLKRYQFGIMIINPKRQFANEIQRIDFLLNNKDITKEKSLFISYNLLSNKNREYMKKNGITFVDDLLKYLSKENITKFFSYVFYLLIHINTLRIIDPHTVLSLLFYYVKWQSFSNKFRLDHLITYCDFGIQSIARNIILSKMNTKTWYYLDSVNFGNLFVSEGNSFIYRNAIFGFLYYDYFVSWNNKTIVFFQKHHQMIRKYIDIGCLWAEHLFNINKEGHKSDFIGRLNQVGYQKGYKIIAVFNSSVSYAALLNYEDSLVFVKDIYRLLNEIPNIFLVFKEKQPRSFVKRYSKKIAFWFKTIEENPRCFFPLNSASPSEIMAFSNLTISFPFTSTTFEALSARKKAIWYDATNKLRNTFYDSIPGLVCHSYDELLKRVKELLFETSEEEYNNYLDKYVKNNIESYLDGKAISRFRNLLLNKEVTLGTKTSYFEFIG